MPKKNFKTSPEVEVVTAPAPVKKNNRKKSSKKLGKKNHSEQEQIIERNPYGLSEEKRRLLLWIIVIVIMMLVIIAWSISWKIQLTNKFSSTDNHSWQNWQENLNVMLNSFKKNTSAAEKYLKKSNENINFTAPETPTFSDEELGNLKKILEPEIEAQNINLNNSINVNQ